MKTKNPIAVLFLILQLTIWAGVPIPKTSGPTIPHFMEQINFQPVLLNVYGSGISGVIPNQYGDLNWNPAFLFQHEGNSAYLDFNYQTSSHTNLPLRYNSSDKVVSVRPGWYNDTHVSGLQLNPLYNFAIVKKISNKISIAIINRTLFDYGPFRSSFSANRYYSRAASSAVGYDKSAYDDLKMETVEVDENQQSVFGTQTEFNLGYKLSSKIDFGLKFGHYIFSQKGNLGDSKYSKQPHSLINNNSDEELKINGSQYEFGAGVIYHLNEKTDLGVYASLMLGNSSEDNIATVSTHSWSENPIDTNYYSISKYGLSSNYSFSSDGVSPFLSLTFQKELSENLTFRTFAGYRYSNKDISSAVFARGRNYSDRTFNSYTYSNNVRIKHFTRSESLGKAESSLDGNGEETNKNFKWFASLIYKRERKWSAFAAVMLQIRDKERDISEKLIYNYTSRDEYFYHQPRVEDRLSSFNKDYHYNYNYTEYSVLIPIGIRAHVYGGFSFLIGTDLRFELTEMKESGKMLYLERISRTKKNGTIIVDDVEKNRPEAYNSVKPMNFSKTSDIHLGAFYEHSSGIKLYVKAANDIFNKGYWTFGIGYAY